MNLRKLATLVAVELGTLLLLLTATGQLFGEGAAKMFAAVTTAVMVVCAVGMAILFEKARRGRG